MRHRILAAVLVFAAGLSIAPTCLAAKVTLICEGREYQNGEPRGVTVQHVFALDAEARTLSSDSMSVEKLNISDTEITFESLSGEWTINRVSRKYTVYSKHSGNLRKAGYCRPQEAAF